MRSWRRLCTSRDQVHRLGHHAAREALEFVKLRELVIRQVVHRVGIRKKVDKHKATIFEFIIQLKFFKVIQFEFFKVIQL